MRTRQAVVVRAPGDLMSRRALRMLAGGAVLGVIGAWATGQAIQATLYHVPALHWATLIGAGVVMGLVCLLACLIPSQRAAGVSPREALQ